MINRVLLLSASAGAGHVRAAQALERAFAISGVAREVRHVDTLDYTNKVFRKLYAQAYIEMVNSAPEVLGWLYDTLDTPWRRERRRLVVDRLNTGPFRKLVREYNPDLIVCTHFLPAEIVSWLKAKGKLSCPQAIVVTDFDVHAMWLCHNYEKYFVALDETKLHLEKLGIPAGKVEVTGIPIDPLFAEKKDRAALCAKHGLDPSRTTILMSAGGFGVGPVEHILQSLVEVQHPVEIVAICGKNEELRKRLSKVASKLPAGSNPVKVVGFTTEMDEYMAVAELIVGKPGGLTTSESLARGLVMVIVNPIPGQEERNSDHLLEEGAAIRCNNLPVLAHKIDGLLADRKRFAAMKAAVARLAHPRAAFDIVEHAARLVRP
ncbi:MAG: UDP-N-acetylglucosamine--LPS N-acetylglucosamine transferase [Acidobacteria bacterium]|nr:UDP-N-acetylglucosamine--LPS N-acetylglucosamine transferase [Acidobacteriota bacterium]